MMKRAALAAFGILLTAAILRAIIPNGPGTLIVEVDADISSSGRLLVGYVPDDRDLTPTLGNITLISPEGGSGNKYTVPAATQIGIFFVGNTGDPITDIVWLQKGEVMTHVIGRPGDS